ncbi:hypothetical protein AGMMS50229_15910 [Campylobacterota bacterium]|nr:hypothetical protein AGMMS50229_15910 [Campylobacterota bacterium]
MDRIFLSPPHMGGGEMAFIEEAFRNNFIAPLGANVTGFEDAIRMYTGANAALGVVSGTAAIHLALRVLGVGAGDRVATSSFTFIGSVTPIVFQGAEPIFIDSDRESWNLSPELLETCLKRDRPKAVIVTHLYGQLANIDAIAALCDHYGATLIEDAAESLGALSGKRQSGTIAPLGIYSFNGNKIITTSGGGMLVAHDPAAIKQAFFLATQARENTPYYEHKTIGYNYRMSNIVAGIGRGQMQVLADRIRRRREIFEYYKQALGDLPINFMPELSGTTGSRWLTTLTIEDRRIAPETVRLALENENIESRALWKPMHLQPVFVKAKSVIGGVSEALFERGVCLPSGTAMTDNDLARICAAFRKVFA